MNDGTQVLQAIRRRALIQTSVCIFCLVTLGCGAQQATMAKGIANVEIKLEYSSSWNKPTFKTDSQGRAEVYASAYAMTVDYQGVYLKMLSCEFEWPCEIVWPIPATSSTNNINTNSVQSTNQLSNRTVWVRNKQGKGIGNVEVAEGLWSEKNRPLFRTDSNGKAVLPGKDEGRNLSIDAWGIVLHLSPSAIHWPCEVTLPTAKTLAGRAVSP
jgi:hypothetical protein